MRVGAGLIWDFGAHGLNLQMPGSTKPILYADLVACLGDVSNTPSVCRNNWILFLPFCLTILNNFSLLSGKSNPISQCRWNDSSYATSTLPLNRDLFLKYYRITRSLLRYMQMISSFSVTYFQKEILFPHQMSPHTSKPPIKTQLCSRIFNHCLHAYPSTVKTGSVTKTVPRGSIILWFYFLKDQSNWKSKFVSVNI